MAINAQILALSVLALGMVQSACSAQSTKTEPSANSTCAPRNSDSGWMPAGSDSAETALVHLVDKGLLSHYRALGLPVAVSVKDDRLATHTWEFVVFRYSEETKCVEGKPNIGRYFFVLRQSVKVAFDQDVATECNVEESKYFVPGFFRDWDSMTPIGSSTSTCAEVSARKVRF